MALRRGGVVFGRRGRGPGPGPERERARGQGPGWARSRTRPAGPLLALLLAAACTRPLAPGEAGFAAALFGPALDAPSVRVASGLGIGPLPRPAPRAMRPVPPGALSCAAAPPTRLRSLPDALVLGRTIFLAPRRYRPDLLESWPARVAVPDVLLLAHELTHVWQWRERARTGYAPGRALAEQARPTGAYAYEIAPGRPFAAYGFEQQARMVEDYLCLRLLEPASPRLPSLRALVAQALPLGGLEAALARGAVDAAAGGPN